MDTMGYGASPILLYRWNDTSYVYGVDRLSFDYCKGRSGYYLYDARGSVTSITNEWGYVVQSYRYNVNGEITFGEARYDNEYTYNGESYNPNIESQYLRARYYDVVTASFLTEDSYLGDINEPLTLNRYNYCVSSPLNYQDPSGYSSEMIDYTEVGDAFLWMLGEVTGDEYYKALAEENREYKKEKYFMEMSFNAGALDSLVRSVLDPLAMAAAILTNLDDLGHVQQEYESIMRGFDNKLAQQATGVLDMNLYYAGSCTMDVTIVVGGIVTIAYAGASAMQYFGSVLSTVASGSGSAYALAGGGVYIEGAAISYEGLIALVQSMGAATISAITTTGPIGDFKNDIGKIDFDGSGEGSTRTVNGFDTTVNAGKQGKHIIGNNNYIEGRSVFNGTVDDAQRLVDDFAGTGEWIGTNKERVNFGEVIGQYVNPATNEAVDTTVGIIHYSRTGTHIVPAQPIQ